MTRDGCWLPWPSPTGAYILLRLRHARHCRPVRLHPRLPSTHNPPLLPGFLSLPLPPRVRKRVARLPIPPPSSPSAARSPRARPRPATSSGSRWRNNRLQRRTTTPGVSFPTQAATGQPQPSLSLENPRPVTRAARADVAKGERVQLFLLSFSLYARARVSRTWSGELVTNGEYRPWSKASSFSRIDKIIRMAYGKEDWNEMATRRIDEILHIVAIDLSFD